MNTNEAKTYAISGWVLINDDRQQVAEILKKHVSSFLNSFNAKGSPHRNSKRILSDPKGHLVYEHSIEFRFKGTYWHCQCFRESLNAFCRVYMLSLDRGLDICLVTK